MKEILIKSTVDETLQPSLFHKASGEKRPLLVALHTWSYDRFNQIDNMFPFAKEYDFNLLLPEFRGPNTPSNPKPSEACGSLFAKQDIKDSIDYIIANENVDDDNIFLVGLSGGGHMALLMAGFIPEYFRAIAAFVPITDLDKWSKENPSYGKHIEHCVGFDIEERKMRSPIAYLDTVAKSNLKIFHGKYDGCVPVSQSVDFYLELSKKYPKSRVFLDVFDGGHEFKSELFRTWILSQYKPHIASDVTG